MVWKRKLFHQSRNITNRDRYSLKGDSEIARPIESQTIWKFVREFWLYKGGGGGDMAWRWGQRRLVSQLQRNRQRAPVKTDGIERERVMVGGPQWDGKSDILQWRASRNNIGDHIRLAKCEKKDLPFLYFQIKLVPPFRVRLVLFKWAYFV